jgi:hypothetical protein
VEAQGAQGRKSLIAKQTDVLGTAELYSETPHPSKLEVPNDKSAGILKRTLTSVQKSYGPKHTKQVPSKRRLPMIQENDDPPPITEDDIDKGMITLLNKGIIPKDVDLTPAFEKGAAPVTVKSIKFHDKQDKHLKREV